MHFFKYHGAGNDFILIDEFRKKTRNRQSLARRLCHRRFGIGADGVLFVEKSRDADARMILLNADGSRAAMCGNGIRCVASFLYEKKKKRKKKIVIETDAGRKDIALRVRGGRVSSIRVDMGTPMLERDAIPALGEGPFVREKLETGLGTFEVAALNTGVPHAVTFVDDVDAVPFLSWAREIRGSPLFPEGANVNFVSRLSENAFRVRTYERGVEDETWACGTGITASAIAAVIMGFADPEKPLRMEARGGTLSIDVVMEDGHVARAYMSGDASYVFEGDL